MRGFFIALTLAAPVAAVAMPPARVYDKQHDLLVDTIRDGKAQGELRGRAAAAFKAQFKSESPLFVSARVVRDYKTATCKRIAVVYRKADIATPKGLKTFEMETKLDYCRDGRAPTAEQKGQQ